MKHLFEKIDVASLDLKDQVVAINRVTKVVKGGKNLSFTALVVVGDGQGHVGYGMGKAREVASAIKKGIEAAKKNVVRVPITDKGSIPHTVTGRFGSGRSAAEAGLRRYGRHRRWRRPRGHHGCWHPEHPDEEPGQLHVAQRGQGHRGRPSPLEAAREGGEAARSRGRRHPVVRGAQGEEGGRAGAPRR